MKCIWEYRFSHLDFVTSDSVIAQIQKRTDGLVSIGMLASFHQKADKGSIVSLIEVDIDRQSIQYSSHLLPFSYIFDLCFAYEPEKGIWYCGSVYPVSFGRALQILSVDLEREAEWTIQAVVGTQSSLVGIGDKRCWTLWCHDQVVECLFLVGDSAEVEGWDIWWGKWRANELQELQYLQTCDAIAAYCYEQGCLLFLYQRAWETKASSSSGQHAAGTWVLSCLSYGRDQKVCHQEYIAEFTVPIHDTWLPEEDLLELYDLQISLCRGPLSQKDGIPTCMVAIQLQNRDPDSIDIVGERLNRGKLLWVDAQGHVLQSQAGYGGCNISLCYCNKSVIAAAVVDERWKLSHRLVGDGDNLQEREVLLSPDVECATVMVQDPEGNHKAESFWCIEEYTSGVRVVAYDSMLRKEMESVWCKDLVFFLDGRNPYYSGGRETMPCKGVVVSENRLVLIGKQGDDLKLLCFQ